MTTLIAIVTGILGLLYAAVRLLVPVAPSLSAFERRRLAKTGAVSADLDNRRANAEGTLLALRTALSVGLLLTVAGVLATGLNGALTVTVTLLFALGVEWLVAVRFVAKWSAKVYARFEGRLLGVADARRYLRFLPVPRQRDGVPSAASEAELVHLVDGMKFLENDRRDLIRSALEFTGLSAADAMSGRRSIHPIDKGEVLGPLLLDELYKTGRQAFVVTDGGVDNIVGVLKLEKLTSLDLRDTPTALRAMSPDVHSIDIDAPITEALAYLRSSKAPFLVVKDGDTTAGLVSMDNILRCLFAD